MSFFNHLQLDSNEALLFTAESAHRVLPKGFLRALPASPCIKPPHDLQPRAFGPFRIAQRQIFEKRIPQFPRFRTPIQQRFLQANEGKKASPKWPEHIKEVILPDTEEGREAISVAKETWQNKWDKDDPKGLSLSLKARQEVLKGKTPFYIVINSKATWNSVSFDGLTFYLGDERGKRFWNIANPISLLDLGWVRKTLFAAALFFLGLGTFCCSNLESVPITGRLRFNFNPGFLAGDSDAYTAQLHALGQFLVPDRDSRVIALTEILEKLIPSSGLEHLEWEIYLVNAPGKFRAPFLRA